MNKEKLSFVEIVNNFTEKFGKEWCNNSLITESVVDTFIDYLKSLPAEKFNHEKINI
jgi:hypothetical protein